MATFEDAAGETWFIEISTIDIRELRKALSIDLLALMDRDKQLLQSLASDPILLVDVVSCLCSSQIRNKGLDEIGFAKRLVGQGLENALDALIEAIANFIPPQRGALIREAWMKAKNLETQAVDRIRQKLQGPELEQQMSTAMDTLLSESGN